MSASAADPARELRIDVKDRIGFPLFGANISLMDGGKPFATTKASFGNATLHLSGPWHAVDVQAEYAGILKQAKLPASATLHTFHFGEIVIMPPKDRIGLWVGLLLWAAAMVLAFVYPEPKALQENLIRASFALGAGGIASVIPGMLNANIGTGGKVTIAAAGALAVWLITFLFVPGKNPLF